MTTSANFRERLLAEAFAERERILDSVRAQLAEVDSVIASLNGVIPTPELELPTPPQATERAAEQARVEKPPKLAEVAQGTAETERAAPGVRANQIVQYLEEHGPSLRRDIVAAIGIQGNTAARSFSNLEKEERALKTEGPPARGGNVHTIYYLPGQDPSNFQMAEAAPRQVKPPSQEARNRGAQITAERADERDQKVIAFIRENGPTLRLGVSKALGIPKGSWGSVTPRLIEKGLATFEVQSGGGKPQVGFMLPGQSIPMGGKMTAAASPVTTKHVDPTSLKPPSPEAKPPPPKAAPPEGKRAIDFGGAERFPEMLRYLPSSDKSMPTKTLRAVLDFERKVLMSLLDGPKLGIVVADELGDRASMAHKGRVRQYLTTAEETGHAERTGEGYPPWADGGGNAKGRSSVEYGITDKGRAALKGQPWTESQTHPPPSTPTTAPTSAPTSEPPSSPTEPPQQEPSASEPSVEKSANAKLEALRKTKVPSYQDVRDAWVMLPDLMMSPGQLIKELELNWPIAIVGAFMEQGAAEGKLTDKSPPGGELRIFQYDPPDGPGKAAQIDIDRPPEPQVVAHGGKRGSPIAGTGAQPVPPHPDAAVLVRDIRKAGGEVDPVGSGHWKVVNPETRQSVRISGTPGNPRTVKNDRKRVKRIGLDV